MSRANENCYPTIRTPNGEFSVEVGGLTIREHFAGLALQGLLASVEPTAGAPARAVVLADALITELAKVKR